MSNNKPKTIKFVYNRIPNYRTYNVDGIFGGLTHRNKIFVELFSEKFDTPESVVHEVSDEGVLGKEINKKRSDAIIREIECGVYLDIPTAKVIVEWLNNRINDFERLVKEKKDKKGK